MRFIFILVRSIFSILYMNLIIFFFKILKKKIIFFFFPRKILAKKDLQYIEDLLDGIDINYKVMFGHQLDDIGKKNYFFLYENFLKYLFGIDLFISNYLSDKFPSNSIKMYIHHCIYDSPLTEKKKELETANRFSNYNYILLSSDFTVKYFNDLIKKFPQSKENSHKNNLQILPLGYPRLDYLVKNSDQNQAVDAIIIAPANFIAYPDHTLINHLEEIINLLLNNFDYQIIYRPHPTNKIIDINTNNNLSYKIAKKFENNNKFEFDLSDNYLKNYFRSKFMISDISGTSFTYSFLTVRPVIFFSPNEELFKTEYENLNHFKDRSKIGIITNNVDEIVSISNELNSNTDKYKNSIIELRNNLKNINTSKNAIQNLIKKVLL